MASVTRNPRPLFVTSLPAGYDGQEVFYQSTTAGTGGGASNSMADVGAVWHLRYRAAASGSYKWEFVGGGTVGVAAGSAYQSTSTGSWYDIGVGAQIKLALAGDYHIESFAEIACDHSAYTEVGLSLSGLPGGAGTAGYTAQAFQWVNSPSAFTNYVTIGMNGQVASVTAASVARQVFQQTSGITRNLQCRRGNLSVTPIRVG